MEFSQYLVFVSTEDGGSFLYNTKSNTTVTASQKLVSSFEANDPSLLSIKEIIELRRLGYIVSTRDSEFADVSKHINKYRSRSDTLLYTLLLTYACNLKCPYCYETANGRRYDSMSLEIADLFLEKALNDLDASKANRIGLTLYGGEPLLNTAPAMYIHDRLDDALRGTEVSVFTSLITNGVKLKEQKFDKLLKKIDFVQITLDAGPAYHNKIRKNARGEGTFLDIIEAIERLLALDKRVSIRIQVNKESIPTLPEGLSILKSRGILDHPFSVAYFFPILDFSNICSSNQFDCSHSYYNHDLFSHLWQFESEYGVAASQQIAPVWHAPYCSFMNKWAYIVDPAGYLYKCVSDVGSADKVVGNLGEPDSENFEQADKECSFLGHSGLNYSKCKQCNLLPICDGGCANLGLATNENALYGPSCELHAPLLADRIKHNILRTIPGEPR